MRKIQHILFYNFLFLAIFFLGFDNYLIWRRTFAPNQTYETAQYIHYGLTVFGGWFIGFFLFQKTVSKYDSFEMIKYSLILASMAAWTQYRVSMQGVNSSFNGTILLNFVFNLSASFLAYTIKKITMETNNVKAVSTNSLVTALLAGFTIAFGLIFINTNLHYYFLSTCIIYALAFLFFLSIPNITEFLNTSSNREKREVKKLSYMGISVGMITLSTLIYFSRHGTFALLNPYCDSATFFLLFIVLYALGKPKINKRFFASILLFIVCIFVGTTILSLLHRLFS